MPAPTRTTQSNSNIKLAVGFLAAALIAVIYYFFFWSDLVKSLRQAHDRQAQLRIEEQSLMVAYKNYIDDVAKLEEKKARLKDLNRVLPETSDQQSFLGAINQQADIAGLSVRRLDVADESVQTYYARLPIRLELYGKYHQLTKFLAGLSRTDRIINVENIEIYDPKVNTNEETFISARCLTTTFRAVVKSVTIK